MKKSQPQAEVEKGPALDPTAPLFGHEEAVGAFLQGLDNCRLHHAWLISGPQGVGKALFAAKAALRTLAQGEGPIALPGLDVPADHRAAHMMKAGSHPDLMRLERLPRDNGDLARSINVNQVRGLQRLFATTASMSPWRVVIIDSIDDLEREAANALLKNLEEPPSHSLFLLVSHAPEKLLPTIRSRCRQLRLSRLDDDAMTSTLRFALPDAGEREIAELVEAGEGCPGVALAYRGLDMHGLVRSLQGLVQKGDRTNEARARLAQLLSAKAAQPRYEAFLTKVPSIIAAEARQRRGEALAEALRLWESAQALSSSATHLSLDPASVVFELSGMLTSLAPREQHG